MCNMMTYEILLELEGLADTIVATPEPMPAAGLPYTDVLQRWAKTVSDGGKSAELAMDCVNVFQSAYEGTPEPASLLAVDMAELSPLVTAMDNLASRLMEPGCGRPMIAEAVQKAARTSDPDFVYLEDLAVYMEEASTAAAAVQDALVDAIPDSYGCGWWGLTVYIPRGPVPEWYKELAVAGTPWGKWVTQFCGG
jgi:hypothetical protein